MLNHRWNKRTMMGRLVVRTQRIRLASACLPMMTVMMIFFQYNANGASTEMMTNIKYVGQGKPIDRADQVVPPDTTEQPIWLGLNTDARGNASADTGGPDVNSAKQREPVDRSGPVDPQSTTEQPVLLGPKLDEKENAPVDPVGQDVNSTGQGEPVDRSGLVGPQNNSRSCSG